MPAVRHCSRIDTFELKVQMERRLGAQKAEKYFNLLTRYLSLKLGKSEFDKLCIRLIGRENVRHHNELIRAIVKNATVSKTPPPKQVKRDTPVALKDPNVIDARNGLQSLCREVFPQSPRKGRTPNLRERKFKDRPSPLGLNEKTHRTEDLATTKVQEQQSATDLISLGSKPPIEVNSVEDGEEVEQDALSTTINRRISVTAPFGIRIHAKETRKVFSNVSSSAYHSETCHYSGQLPPTKSLENRLKKKLKMEGLDVSMDSVNLLNSGLDSYLKRVIKLSLELAGSRSTHKPSRRFTTSMLDFRVATETNPKILGEDWPKKLEKICLFAFEQSAGLDSNLNNVPE
ncbi:uncharacterized protein LOC112522682 [Cynara cardunculus var. scolymus]|uniref:Transcriptional coactivator Hfi1/Transcriptional adapter 1 n=1 Tax=Cynara cardunculus var. scolymus TaxID=59895 RepID=A0A118K5E4_CYNCS|nr:uncharacterized protein LOC112522682 [Cynara cardunculus var. scolymus]KVI08958.1 Transcriptional coactivator Hfi1/Transcriptional adapter 1 [Cynara cardunculus var. scolymus]